MQAHPGHYRVPPSAAASSLIDRAGSSQQLLSNGKRGGGAVRAFLFPMLLVAASCACIVSGVDADAGNPSVSQPNDGGGGGEDDGHESVAGENVNIATPSHEP
jgi:hypothetical protein